MPTNVHRGANRRRAQIKAGDQGELEVVDNPAYEPGDKDKDGHERTTRTPMAGGGASGDVDLALPHKGGKISMDSLRFTSECSRARCASRVSARACAT